ncbi:MAG TPA: hypothetical protein VIM11_13075 [Tepidisphaeraceae bacterium]|jgi:hypothetical protein
MRYHVHGISRNTGLQTTLVVDAKHHEAAEAIAQRQLVVSEVVPVGGLAEPEIFDRNAADGIPEPFIFDLSPALAIKLRPSRKRIWLIAMAILLAILVVVVLRRRP